MDIRSFVVGAKTSGAKGGGGTADYNALLQELDRIGAEIWRTASGNPATFADGYAANVKDLIVTITPKQAGSGDPAPTNVRPITGLTSVGVVRTGENGGNSKSVTVSMGNAGTVYGGTLNVATGELTVTHKRLDLGTLDWARRDIHQFMAIFDDDSLYGRRRKGYATECLCDSYKGVEVSGTGSLQDMSFLFNSTLAAMEGNVLIKDSRIDDKDAFKAAVSGHTLLYALKTPAAYRLTPAQLATLAGYNAVSTDADTLAVTYRADPALSFSLGGG